MLALVDLYLCIHRILLHYLIKICVIIQCVPQKRKPINQVNFSEN